MAALKNTRRERFAQLMAKGDIPKCDAYRVVFPNCRKWKRNAVNQRAYELAKRPDVAARIEEIQAIPVKATIASRTELAEFLTRVVRTPIGNVTPDSDLAQEHDAEAGKIKMPGKRECVDSLAKLMGYNEPEKTDTTFKFEPDEAVLKKLKL
jgi:hypothetical protein